MWAFLYFNHFIIISFVKLWLVLIANTNFKLFERNEVSLELEVSLENLIWLFWTAIRLQFGYPTYLYLLPLWLWPCSPHLSRYLRPLNSFKQYFVSSVRCLIGHISPHLSRYLRPLNSFKQYFIFSVRCHIGHISPHLSSMWGHWTILNNIQITLKGVAMVIFIIIYLRLIFVLGYHLDLSPLCSSRNKIF